MLLPQSRLTGFGFDSPSLRRPRLQQNIIAPVWNITDADAVLRQATSLAAKLDAGVRLVCIRSPDLVKRDDVVAVDDGTSIGFRLRYSDHLSELARRWSHNTSVAISVATRTSTDIVTVLGRELASHRGVVVVQQDMATVWTRLWRWNWLTQIVSAPFPVLVLPAEWENNWPGRERPMRVVISVTDDAATGARTVLPITGPHAEYTLLRILPLSLLESMQPERRVLPGSLSGAGRARHEAWRSLRASRREIERAGGTAATEVVFDAATAGKAIQTQADARKAHLVVIGRQRRSIRSLFHCEWKYLAMNSKVPVLFHSA